MAVKYTSGSLSQSLYSTSGVATIKETTKAEFNTRVVESEANCLSHIPAMLRASSNNGERVFPCLALLDIDGTIHGNKNEPVPAKTSEAVNWLLSKKNIYVIAVTSRLSVHIGITQNQLEEGGMKLVGPTNKAIIDNLTTDIKNGIPFVERKGLSIKNNIVYTSGGPKGYYIEQIIKAVEKEKKLTFGTIFFVDNDKYQIADVTHRLTAATHPKKHHLQIQHCIYFNPSQHDTSGCSCDLPEFWPEAQPKSMLPEAAKSMTSKRMRSVKVDELSRQRGKAQPPK